MNHDTQHRLLLHLAWVVHTLLVGSALPSEAFDHQDEPLWIASTRTMHETGDFLLPRFHEDDRPRKLMGVESDIRINKPILFYWLIALPQFVFGHGLWSSRLVSLLASVAMIAVAWRITDFFFRDSARRVLAIWLLVSTDVFFRYSHYAVPEMTLTLAMTAAHMMFLEYDRARSSGRTGRSLLLGFHALMAIGFLIKGPVAIVLPMLTCLCYYASRRRWVEACRLVSPPGLLLVLAFIAPWYLLLAQRLGWSPMVSMMRHEVGSRVGFNANVLYFVPLCLVYFLPMSGMILLRIGYWMTGGRRRSAIARCVRSYPFIWLTVYLLFYSVFVGEKHAWYVLGWCAPAAVLGAAALGPIEDASYFLSVFRLCRGVAIALGAVCLVGGLWLGDVLASTGTVVALCAVLAAGAVALTAAARGRPDAVRGMVTIGLVAMLCHWVVFRLVYETTQIRPVSAAARVLKARRGPYALLVNERYVNKKIQLYELPGLDRLSYEERPERFHTQWREAVPDYVICRGYVWEGASESLRDAYRIAASGYVKMRRERKTGAAGWLRWLKTRDPQHAFDRMVLLERRETVIAEQEPLTE